MPADGPDLAGAEHPGERDRAELVCHGTGIVVGLGVHVRATAVAGEEQRRLGPPAVAGVVAQRGAQVGVRALGVAGMEAERLPHPDRVADGERALVGVAAHHRPHQVVVRPVLGPVLVDDEARQEAVLDEVAAVVVEARHDVGQALVGGPPGQLVDDVPVGARDHHLRPDRGAPLRHEHAQPDLALEGDGDRAVAHHPPPADEGVLARPVAAGGEPAHRDGAVEPALDALEERVRREGVRIGDQQHRLAHRRQEVGGHLDRRAVAGVADAQVVHARPAAGEARCEQAHGRHALELAARADDGLGGRARERRRPQDVRDRGGGRLGLARVLRREEQERDVGRRTCQLIAHLIGRLLGGRARVGQRRHRRRGAGAPAHSRIRQSLSIRAVVEAVMKQSRSALPVSSRAAPACPGAMRAWTTTSTCVNA